jgi:hypothetical protein
MPIAIILTIMPAALLGTVMVLMMPGEDRSTALAMGFAVLVVGILFVSVIVLMRDQHPSHAGGDSHLPQDRSPVDEDDAEGEGESENEGEGEGNEDFDDAVTPPTWLARGDDGAPPRGS